MRDSEKTIVKRSLLQLMAQRESIIHLEGVLRAATAATMRGPELPAPSSTFPDAHRWLISVQFQPSHPACADPISLPLAV